MVKVTSTFKSRTLAIFWTPIQKCRFSWIKLTTLVQVLQKMQINFAIKITAMAVNLALNDGHHKWRTKWWRSKWLSKEENWFNWSLIRRLTTIKYLPIDTRAALVFGISLLTLLFTSKICWRCYFLSWSIIRSFTTKSIYTFPSLLCW